MFVTALLVFTTVYVLIGLILVVDAIRRLSGYNKKSIPATAKPAALKISTSGRTSCEKSQASAF
jgi:hypothetical protein